MTQTNIQQDDERMLDELLQLRDPDHPRYLMVDFTDRQCEFLDDLESLQWAGDLILTERQRGWLCGIYGLMIPRGQKLRHEQREQRQPCSVCSRCSRQEKEDDTGTQHVLSRQTR